MRLRGELPPGRDAVRDGVTERDGYIVVQALAYAIAADSLLPEEERSPSNRDDMLALLTALCAREEVPYRLADAAEAMSRVHRIQQRDWMGKIPHTPPHLDRRG